jgi:peptidyl-prolyl cis-trans isomerase C
MKRLIAILLVMILTAACGREQQEIIGAEAGPAPAEGYIVQVGESYITARHLEQEMASMPESRRMAYSMAGGQERLLDEMIKREMFRQEAVRAGLDQSDEYRQRVEYLSRLALVEMFLEDKIQAEVTVSDREVSDYYEQHKENEFTNPLSGETQPFLSVRDNIRRYLLMEKQRQVFDDYMAEMLERYVVRMAQDPAFEIPQTPAPAAQE